jgi:lipopolysaccharide/colanic/teichoic acid biosynthesis glycosyltransferase
MVKRFFDFTFSLIAIICLLPVFVFIAISIKLSSKGPIIYKAKRVGLKEKNFTMFKFKSMRINSENKSVITSAKDARIFPFGQFLRKSKLDELPQLFNILIGDMSIIGPRPEDPKIVNLYYLPIHKESLSVKPGLASPGSIYNYSHIESQITDTDPEQYYINNVLNDKVMLDVIYSRKAGFFYDISIMFRTIKVLLLKAVGKTQITLPPEFAEISNIRYN